MVNESSVLFEKQGHIGILTLNRPPANAYHLEMLNCFNTSLRQAINDPEINAIIVDSSSEKFFCAGADIKVFEANTTEENAKMISQARENMALIENCEKVVIAVINGHCLGGGLEIALACDIRFAAKHQYLIGLPEINLGLIPGNGGSQRLTRLIGVSNAIQMLSTGDSISAQEAYRMGLINQLFDSEELMPAAVALASKLGQGPALAIAATKKAVYGGALLPMAEALELEKRLVDTLYDTQDGQEGFRAFVEKRPAQFTGK
ncbi:enoyl-CoA hydratase/isomerase family protein [Alginatibacterium sediminis]|uniref:Enoyl-CoA hydratase/isomerase family protein n=1 Tax=Alginatibacterium sediminis TaxID=2164068 RepID=A0A420EB84_9ALTE|nr:enoyl-CoA hydratase/isomerase family protein [Alginatibacterium sediminis]RKF17940.1 enoyl-CoA hydratase/isomerase family protein [Alginatibacterium sediminis]